MKIQIESPQPSYLIGEDVEVDFALDNPGPEAFTLPGLNDPYGPQPYFVISGPSFPEPYRFHWSGRAPTGSQPPREMRTVAAGASLSTRYSLPPSLTFTAPGSHELFATYERNGTVTESNRIEVMMEAPGAPLFRVVGRTPLFSEVAIQALSVDGSALFLATFNEERPDIGETSFGGVSRIATAEAGATDFFAPWCQTAEPGVIGPRFGWRHGRSITVAGFHKLPQRVDLPFVPKIHPPSLMAANGDIDLLVTDESGMRLALVRFPSVGYDAPPPAARVMWTHPLQQPVSDVVGTINPSGHRVAVLRQGNAISFMTWNDTAPHVEPGLTVEGVAVASVAPAVHASLSNAVRASVLTLDSNNERRAMLTEFTWKPGAPPVAGAPQSLPLPGAITSGTIAYSMSAIENPRRAWFFMFHDKLAESSLSGGKAQAIRGDVPLPPQLLVMSQATYLLRVRKKPELMLLP